MGDVLMVLANGVHHITFHDLHVEDVIKQFESFGANPLDQLHAPGRVIAHVIWVRPLAVKQFHAHRDLMLLSDGGDPLEADGAIFQALVITHTGAIP